MRVIEQQMINAIKAGRNFSKSNTDVIFNGNDFKVYLHGNCIAKRIDNQFYVNWCGWVTRVTRDRLNALSNDKFNIKQATSHMNNKPCDCNAWLKSTLAI